MVGIRPAGHPGRRPVARRQTLRLRTILAGIAAAAALVAVAVLPSTSFAVVGGTVAQDDYPFLINLTLTGAPNGDLHRCGAAMVNSQWAVTAAHCVDGAELTDLVARVGSNDRTTGGQVRTVTRKIVHLDYGVRGEGQLVNDIAVIKLSAQVDVEPVRIARSAATPGTATRIVGWGSTCIDSTPACQKKPVQLHELDTHIAAPGDCADMDPANELCTGDPAGGSGACHGDSGGPQLVAAGHSRWEIVGVTSRSGHGETICAQGPSIYTSVPAHAGWITDTLRRAG